MTAFILGILIGVSVTVAAFVALRCKPIHGRGWADGRESDGPERAQMERETPVSIQQDYFTEKG